MARCAYCEAETELYDGHTPICMDCDIALPERRAVRAELFHNLHQATKRAEAALEAFALVNSDIPSGLPHPDGVQRIHNASLELTAARDEMMNAHNRLNDFLETGVVPDDLKRSG
jgi:hypothetical protein